MSQLILKGIGTGLLLSVMLGPAFFILIETSIKKGIRAALAFDLGVIFSDILYIFLAYFFIQQVDQLSFGSQNAVVKAIGGILLVIYGYVTFSRRSNKIKVSKGKKIVVEDKNYYVLAIKGFLLNLINPAVLFYWFSVMAFGRSGNSNVVSGLDMFIFLGAVLSTFACIDILKIMGAKQLRPFLTPNFLESLNRITGIILMAFGVFLVVNATVIWIK